MKDHLFPSINPSEPFVPPSDGSLFPTPEFCKHGADRAKCLRFYTSIEHEEGFHVCPYGFTSSVHQFGTSNLISTGLRVEGHFERKKLKKRIKQDLIPPLTEQEFIRFVQFSLSHHETNQKSESALDELRELNQFMRETFHEIRKLNRDLKSQAEELNINIDRIQSDENSEFIKYRIQNVYGSSSLVSIRLDSFDLLSNPLGVTATNPTPIAVYRKFEKVRHCLDNKSKLQKVRIVFQGTSYKEIPGYEIFELLPYVLFENALKYSPKNQDIIVEFDNSTAPNAIQITSVGPMMDKSELPFLFQKGKRGKHASLHFPGTGVGLFFAKQVCDIHQIKINASVEHQELFNLNGVPYARFSIELSLP